MSPSRGRLLPAFCAHSQARRLLREPASERERKLSPGCCSRAASGTECLSPPPPPPSFGKQLPSNFPSPTKPPRNGCDGAGYWLEAGKSPSLATRAGLGKQHSQPDPARPAGRTSSALPRGRSMCSGGGRRRPARAWWRWGRGRVFATAVERASGTQRCLSFVWVAFVCGRGWKLSVTGWVTKATSCRLSRHNTELSKLARPPFCDIWAGLSERHFVAFVFGVCYGPRRLPANRSPPELLVIEGCVLQNLCPSPRQSVYTTPNPKHTLSMCMIETHLP